MKLLQRNLGFFLSIPAFTLVSEVSGQSILFQFEVDGFVGSTGPSAGSLGTNDMPWGILVDTGGNGFSTSIVDFIPSNYSSITDIGNQFTQDVDGLTDDYFVRGNLTFDNTAAGPPVSPYFNGVGGMIGEMTVGYDNPGNPVSSGHNFALFWSEGGSFGLLESNSFSIPSSGVALNFNAATLAAVSSQGQLSSYAFGVPEPSGALLFAIAGLLSTGVRRRS